MTKLRNPNFPPLKMSLERVRETLPIHIAIHSSISALRKYKEAETIPYDVYVEYSDNRYIANIQIVRVAIGDTTILVVKRHLH